MKSALEFVKKIATRLSPYKNLAYISIAAWIIHIILRIMLLFRSNPYGFPFVSKPDWYIFHAISIDFMWICNALFIFLLLGTISKKNKLVTILYAVFHGVILPVTLLDHEIERFLGSHLSFGLANTYKDTSSIAMFYDYVANDNSIPFLQFFVLALMLPFAYIVYRIIRRLFTKRQLHFKVLVIFMVIFYIASYLFVNVIWTGNARMTKLRPVVALIYRELTDSNKNNTLSKEDLKAYAASYRALWQYSEGDSLWIFEDLNSLDKSPLYRKPSQELLNSESLKKKREERPNFIVVFMESHRGLNTGYLNSNEESSTPFLDSLAANSRAFFRMHTSGLPTTGGVLTSHTGLPAHSRLAEATDLAHVTLPSFASVLTNSGYSTHYFSAADPAWDNLGVWMSKWYTASHYDRNREDDSLFMNHAASFIADSMAHDTPFLATLTTRSNHYPFNFANGMTISEKSKPLTERVKYTMRYADRQLANFIHALENKPWFKNTYLIVLADHAFPLGENGVSTMNGGGFSNATWIPLVISGHDIEAFADSSTASQIDLAPTILELAGLAVPNIFMGHNLLRGHGFGYSLGVYSKVAAIGYDGFREIVRYPLYDGAIDGLFEERDTHQKNDLQKDPSNKKRALQLKLLLDTLVKISDFSLERGF